MSDAPAEDHLTSLRLRIDAVDAAMVELLAERYRLVSAVADLKAAHGIPARLGDRVEAVVANVRGRAAAAGCSSDFAEHVWRAMIEWVIAFEERHLAAARDG